MPLLDDLLAVSRHLSQAIDGLERVIVAYEEQERARLAVEAHGEEEDFSDLWDKGDRSEAPADEGPGFLERARAAGVTDSLALGALIEKETGGAPSWTVPQEAGGASVYVRALQEFCAITRRPLDSLDDTKARAWLKKIERIAENQRIESPAVMAEAIRRLRDTHAWHLEHDVWTSPFVDTFVSAVGLIAARVSAGEFEGQDESDDNRTRGEHQAQAAAIGLAGRIT